MPAFFDLPILAIETSCDETSAAVVVGHGVRSNVVASQIEMHRKWGGIVPEAAARAHIEAILPVIDEALAPLLLSRPEENHPARSQPAVEIAGGIDRLGAIAVTSRPGLVGALSVGVSAAKALAHAWQLPLLGVHHLEGHLSSILAECPDAPLPHLALIVSGGHTETVLVRNWGRYEIAGRTIDDAAGEAFDKGARLLGLGYPGGFAIQQAAMQGDSTRYPLPRGLSGDTLDFSFSGLKTAVLRLAEKEGAGLSIPDAAASLQEAIVSVLADRAVRAAIQHQVTALSLVGGVAANLALRQRLATACDREGIDLITPALEFCTDNAAMIGLAASWRLASGERSRMDLDVQANAELA